MIIRVALPGEVEPFSFTGENGELKFVLVDGESIVGFIAMSRVQMPKGVDTQLWIHDVAHWSSDPHGLVRLCAQARAQGKEWGFKEFRTNVSKDSPFFDVWLSHGLEIDQYVLKGEL